METVAGPSIRSVSIGHELPSDIVLTAGVHKGDVLRGGVVSKQTQGLPREGRRSVKKNPAEVS